MESTVIGAVKKQTNKASNKGDGNFADRVAQFPLGHFEGQGVRRRAHRQNEHVVAHGSGRYHQVHRVHSNPLRLRGDGNNFSSTFQWYQ